MEHPQQNDSTLQNTEQKKILHKISFKCKKTSVYHHHANSTTTNTNMVAYLASKFNNIENESKSQQPVINRLIKRMNSYKATQVQVDKLKRTTRKPSVKMKPVIKSTESHNKTAEERFISGNVRAAIENFERRSLDASSKEPTPLVHPRKAIKSNAQIIFNPAQTKTDPKVQIKNIEPKEHTIISPLTPVVPNMSFLWRKRSQEFYSPNEVDSYEIVDVKPSKPEEHINQDNISHAYEYCRMSPKYEDLEDSLLTKPEDIYEIIPCMKQQEPLPSPPKINASILYNDSIYESIYNVSKVVIQSDNYETIYDYKSWELVSNPGSLISDQKSNSLYERAPSACSTINNEQTFSDTSNISDKSDEWVDVSDTEDHGASPFVIIRAKHKNRPTGWTQKIRDQWNKTQSEKGDTDGDHHYETLYSNEASKDFDDSDDSFESDIDVKTSLEEVDMNNLQLPELPTYGFTKLAVSAGKHMKRLRKNWSLTKNDITKSFKRIRKRKPSVTNLEIPENQSLATSPSTTSKFESADHLSGVVQELRTKHSELDLNEHAQSVGIENAESDLIDKRRSDGFLNKFRRSLSVSSNDITQTVANRTKSTFYLTDTIDIDKAEETEKLNIVVRRNLVRPQSPPPPIPSDVNQNHRITKTDKEGKRSTSWYAEVGLFKNGDNALTQRPNTSWYAEIGLYHTSSTGSTSNTSSNENSGNTSNLNISPRSELSEDYYNLKNETDSSNNSSSTVENSYSNQLRLQDEPLYQFYDAAVFDDSMDDFDSETYEDVHDSLQKHLYHRPSAMELISPNKNGSSLNRTLWCEIPEVIQSNVLSTLNSHQQKIQEAKFEMITSEASYLNSLHVLWDHFIANLNDSNLLSNEEKYILFGKIRAVKRCSKSLLSDMEKCWQDNILLNGICDIIKKHVDSNFIAYVPYCENQILLDSTLSRLRERGNCYDLLKQLESSPICQSLTLHSFLLLPMQRITRWPLLMDAVLKRLSPDDCEYSTCEYTLGALNKIVSECNEAARKKEQETEIKKISAQIEFPKNMSIINLLTPNRQLIRSGPLVHMQARADDARLTFGKRFSKIPINLFLFNDLLLVCKPKSDGTFTILHYCFRSYVDLNTSDAVQTLPTKETQGRNLLFLTLLENHEGKLIEMLLSCNSESDKERWITALSSPVSDNPDEILYDCWDCPQVTAVHVYNASQPDEIALNRGDVVNVDRKMADGWYHGERLRDGQAGWFPGNYTVEIVNPHVRARNLKQRYRFLALSQNYLKTK